MLNPLNQIFMDTLRLISLVVVFTLLSACDKRNEYPPHRVYNHFTVRGLNTIDSIITSANLEMYKENSNFKELEKAGILQKLEKSINGDSTELENHFFFLYFKGFDSILRRKDYILIINEKDTFKIENITTYSTPEWKLKYGGIEKKYKEVDSLTINGTPLKKGNLLVDYTDKK